MSDKFKESKFYRAMKNPRVTRAIYISFVVLLVAVAVIVGLTAAANRAKKNPNDTQPPVSDSPETTTGNPSVKPPVTTDPPVTTVVPDETTTPASPTVSPSPDLSLPVAGKIIKKHDAKVQVFSVTMNDYRVHLGVDVATAAGAPVYAAADGTVSKIWKDPLMGYCVALEHAADTVTVYKNLAATLPDGIVEGAKVKAGKQIASVGDSAMVEVAEEPHLHFEMTVDGIQVDPLKYFSAKDVASLSDDTAYEG